MCTCTHLEKTEVLTLLEFQHKLLVLNVDVISATAIRLGTVTLASWALINRVESHKLNIVTVVGCDTARFIIKTRLLFREDPPVPDAPFFTKEVYDKYSLAPSVRELWESLQRYFRKKKTFLLISIFCQFYSECNLYFLFFHQLVKVRQRMAKQRTSLVLVLQKPWRLTTSVKEKKTASGIVVIVIIRAQTIPWTVKKKNASRPTNLQQSSRVRLRWLLPTLNPDYRTPACPACPPKITRPILIFWRIKKQDFLHRYWYFFFLYAAFFFYLTCMFCSFPKRFSLQLQNLQARVNREVMHFMQYLQDVANQCADDYNFITEAALQYSEVLLASLHMSPADWDVHLCILN